MTYYELFSVGSSACRPPQQIVCSIDAPYRTVDGLCNNLVYPKWGAINQPLARMHKGNYYYDGEIIRIYFQNKQKTKQTS